MKRVKSVSLFLLIMLIVLSAMPIFAGARRDTDSGKIELEAWSVTGGDRSKYWEERFRMFEKQFPDVIIRDEYQIQPDFEKKLPTAIASGIAPAIWTQTYRSVSDYAPQIQPMTDDIAKFIGYTNTKAVQDSWVPGALAQYMHDGKIYGFPYQIQYFAMAINKQHFMDAGLDPMKDYPKTWDDLITVGKKLTQWKDGRITREAITFPYSGPPIWYIMYIQPMMAERGIDFFNADGTVCQFNRPEVVDAIRHIKRRFDEGVSDVGLSTTSEYMQTLGMGENSIAILDSNGAIAEFERQYPQTKGQLMLIPNPAYPGTTPKYSATTWGYSVYGKQSEAKRQWAWKVIEFLVADPESAMRNYNFLIPRSGWETTEWAKLVRDTDMIAAAAAASIPSGSVVHWPELQFPVQRAMQRILFENADIQAELDRATVEIMEAVKAKNN
jgi:multiple sugar transport system substrate-binding protein